MALPIQYLVSSTKPTLPSLILSKPPPVSHPIKIGVSLTIPKMFKQSRNQFQMLKVKAIEESKETTESETMKQQQAEVNPQPQAELSELGAEIKKAMKERQEEREENLWSGVVDEIREIEWPVFGKVLGTTGVVLGVIAGSSVVLLTVNFVLAELSDKVFAGRGVQDFFS